MAVAVRRRHRGRYRVAGRTCCGPWPGVVCLGSGGCRWRGVVVCVASRLRQQLGRLHRCAVPRDRPASSSGGCRHASAAASRPEDSSSPACSTSSRSRSGSGRPEGRRSTAGRWSCGHCGRVTVGLGVGSDVPSCRRGVQHSGWWEPASTVGSGAGGELIGELDRRLEQEHGTARRHRQSDLPQQPLSAEPGSGVQQGVEWADGTRGWGEACGGR